MSALVSLKDISLTLEKKQILENINFEIASDQLVTLIGPNGAGKTSLLRILTGLQKPSSGRLHWHKKTRVGYMPQKLSLNEMIPICVEDFLKLWHKDKTIKLEEVLKQVGATHLLKSSIHTLSGGEKQRILLARALLQKPQLLILDEPVQGVDVLGQEVLYQLILSLKKSYRCAVFIVSHDMNFVHESSDQVICLNKHICCSGHPEHVRKDPKYKSLFGHVIAKGLAPYTHNHDHCHDPLTGDVEEEDDG